MSDLGDGAAQDERDPWVALLAGEQPHEAGLRLGIPRKRVEYLCNKWSRRGIYEWGVVHDRGWVVRRKGAGL